MFLICIGAFAAGLLTSYFLSFLPFAASLVGAILLGFAIVLAQGHAPASTALSALAILVSCQVGYGARLLWAALADTLPHSHHRQREAVTPEKRLQSEQE